MRKVMVFGTFDIIHLGHIHFLQMAKKCGDYLIVVLSKDENVIKIKGHEPVFSEKNRKIILENIKVVDEVIIGKKNRVYDVIKNKHPDIIALGYDQKSFVNGLHDFVKRENLKVCIKKIKSFRKGLNKSSKIINYITQFI